MGAVHLSLDCQSISQSREVAPILNPNETPSSDRNYRYVSLCALVFCHLQYWIGATADGRARHTPALLSAVRSSIHRLLVWATALDVGISLVGLYDFDASEVHTQRPHVLCSGQGRLCHGCG